MKSISFTVVDAFTDTVFKGNPAAVIVMDSEIQFTDDTLQNIAREFNLSETAFVKPHEADVSLFDLRWFTPKSEVALCGHATLASAHVLFRTLAVEEESIYFQTQKSGMLVARRIGAAQDALIELEFPAGGVLKVSNETFAKVKECVAQAVGVENAASISYVGAAQGVSFGTYLLIDLGNCWDLGSKHINAACFTSLGPEFEIIMLTTTAKDPSMTFISRVFAPNLEVPEDPVTGSAHCVMGPYWHSKLNLEDGAVMVANQASMRGGRIEVIWEKAKGTCKLRGSAVVATKGQLFLPE